MENPVDNSDERYEQYADAAHRRWRPATANRCPLTVAGRRCAVRRRPDELCICQRYGDLLDHARIWLNPGGSYVLTAEPYGASGDGLVRFVLEATGLGLRVGLSGYSPHNPGGTFMITVSRRVDD